MGVFCYRYCVILRCEKLTSASLNLPESCSGNKAKKGATVLGFFSATLYVVSECLPLIAEKNWGLTSQDNSVGEG